MSPRQHAFDFERLVREHHAAVYRAALRVALEPQAAEDATQQVYLALLEGRLALAASRDERAVLRWWAVRAALDGRRGARHRAEREEEHAMPERHEDPAELAAGADERGTLARLVDSLPEPLRLALRLRFEEGLTYARVGEALAVSEPVAHERVRRALETLRVRLRAVGLVALAADLEPRLADPPQAPIPAGLVERLGSLGAATGAATSWTLALGAACAAALVVGGTWLVLRPAARGGDASTTLATPHVARAAEVTAEVVPAGARTVVSSSAAFDAPSDVSAASPAVAEPRAWIHGRVRDASGAPIADAQVTAASVERSGKFPRELVEGASAADGSFELELPVLSDDGTSWSLSATHAGLAARRDEPLRAPPDVRTEAGELVLSGVSDARPGPWTLSLRAVDPAGAPVAGAVVRVLPRVERTGGASRPGAQEARGVTDAGGWVELAGDTLGSKRVRVDARSQGRQVAERELDVDGAHTLRVTLEPGLELRGRLLDADGRALEPVAGQWASDPQLFASAEDPNEWLEARFEPGGRFRIVGLSPAPHRVFIQSDTFSPIAVEDVLPGGEPLEIALKRRDEVRDVGPHCAEVHGRLVDARTGASVAADPDDVEVEWMPADAGDDFARDVLPDLLWPRPRQTAAFGDPPPRSADFHLVGLRPGRYVVAARVHGFAPALSEPLELSTHAMVRDLELRLQPPARLEGVVRDLDGTPLAGAWVLLTGAGPHSEAVTRELDRDVRETDGRPAAWSRNLMRADAEGRFAFDAVPPDLVCTLVALHPRRAPASRAECRPGTAVEVAFTAARER